MFHASHSFSAAKTSFKFRIGLALSLVFALVFAMAPVQAFAAVERSVYIVQIQPGTDIEVRKAIASMGETPLDELDYVLDGFTLNLTALEAEQLALNPAVISVSPDEAMSLFDVDTPTKSWGLDRLDQLNTTYDQSFTYPSSAGAGVRIYVADTGVQANHPDLAGRVLPGFDALGQGLSATDCHGHGTHVSGTAAGTQFGVAKQALIVPVRVLSCTGSGSYAGLITALDWVVANHPAGTPGIVSLSLGGPKSSALNAAMEKVHAAGILTVVAAGNSNLDACTVSPASAPNAITVGASTSADSRASFSNWGECTDMFAPGAAITSDNAKDFNAPLTWNGTSMATPHVSGAAALYLSANPSASPAEVTLALKQNGQAGVISNSNTPNGNILLNTSFLNSANPAPIAGVPAAPAAPKVTSVTRDAVSLSWLAPADGGSPLTGYNVEFRSAATAVWSSITTDQTNATIGQLSPTTGYQVRVTAINAVGVSAPSPIVVLTTAGDAPATPTGLRVYANWGFGTQFTWNPVASSGINPIKGYRLELLKGDQWVEGTYTTSVYGVIGGLKPMTDYTMRLMAVNNWGASAPTAPFNFRTSTPAPLRPASLTASEITASSAKISWAPVARTVETVPISYVITYGRSGSATAIQTVTSAETAVVITGLSAKNSYWASVKAQSETAQSATTSLTFVTLATVPSAPYFNMGSRSGNVYNLAWATALSGGEPITSYVVQRLDGEVWVEIAQPTLPAFTVPMPARATSTTYRVMAKNLIGLSEPSKLFTINTPADKASAPNSLTISAQNLSVVTLTWSAPTDDGGAPILGYALMRSTDNGATWIQITNVTSGSALLGAPAKGAAFLYKVAARNSSGTGDYSQPIRVETPISIAAKASSAGLALTPNYKVLITWKPSADTGGTAITGFLLQKLTGASWVDLATVAADVRAQEVDRDAMGARMQIRVITLNSVGQSEPFLASALTMPYDKASAPLALAATTNLATLRTTLTWQAPQNNGGSPVTSYNLQFSTDNGVTYRGLLTASSTSISISAPVKGVAVLYRLSANTLGGNGAYSESVSVLLEKSVPGLVALPVAKFASDSNVLLTWSSPADTGGDAITNYRIESLDGANWKTLATVAASVKSQVVTRGQPGAVQVFRIFAINGIGESAPTAAISIAVPLVRANAPTNLAVDLTSRPGSALISYAAPDYLGGAAKATYYAIEYSDNGTNWLKLTTPNLVATTAAPPKATTRTYRVYAYTSFGAGLTSAPVTVSVAATAPSAPNSPSVSFAPDGAMVLKWAKPTDLGGSPLISYLVEKQVAGVWSIAAELSAESLARSFARESAGAQVAFRVSAKNSVGTSVASRIVYLQTPYLQANEVTNLSIKATTAGRGVISWTAPSYLGGGVVSRYNIEFSTDNGATWRLYYTSVTTSYSVQAPRKGITWMYRVSAVTQWGAGLKAQTTFVGVN